MNELSVFPLCISSETNLIKQWIVFVLYIMFLHTGDSRVPLANPLSIVFVLYIMFLHTGNSRVPLVNPLANVFVLYIIHMLVNQTTCKKLKRNWDVATRAWWVALRMCNNVMVVLKAIRRYNIRICFVVSGFNISHKITKIITYRNGWLARNYYKLPVPKSCKVN